jgi:ubiquinone biosynthesis protein UbiJ
LDNHAELADCVIRTDEQTLLELLHGTRSFATTMMSDRLRIHGDRLLAIAFFTRASEDQPDGSLINALRRRAARPKTPAAQGHLCLTPGG